MTPPAALQKPSIPTRLERLVAGDEDKGERARFARLKALITIQTWILAVLGFALLVILPFAQPVYMYYAIKPDKQTKQMVGLDVPNITDHAVLLWATTSVTEIMTMGFGDIDAKLPKQRKRFTERGWDAYTEAFVHANMGDKFKHGQLVLTTVPSNTPVVSGKGTNEDDVYQWNLQMPVIMTYATNNNVTNRQKHIIALSIVRVPPDENAAGIAIQNWSLVDN